MTRMNMREMQARRKAGTPAGERHKNIVSPYQQRAKSKTWKNDTDTSCVVVPEQLAAFDAMPRPKQPPRKREPERSDAARIAARNDRNGIA